MTKTFVERLKQTDWRIIFGICVTALWIIGGVAYLRGGEFSRATLYDIPLAEIGSFLEGAFAPLAFLWLVIGLFIQQKELADNTDVLRQTSMESEKQTQAIAATEMNARQETFFTIAENVKRQLGGIAGMLFVSSMGASEGQLVPADRMRELWKLLATGDDQVFSREFLMLDEGDYGGYEALFYKTPIRRRHSKNFMIAFDRLLTMAKNCDTANGIITDSLSQTGHGLLYTRMRQHLPEDMKGDLPPSVDAALYESVLERSQGS